MLGPAEDDSEPLDESPDSRLDEVGVGPCRVSGPNPDITLMTLMYKLRKSMILGHAL